MTKTTATLLAASLLLSIAASAAQACAVDGRIAPAPRDGQIYIPLQSSYSGTLGAPLGGGRYVGFQSDSTTLSWLHPTSSGFVTFEILFDLSDYLPAGTSLDRSSASLELVFDDMDFKPVLSSGVSFREELTLNFLRDAGGSASGAAVELDETNYHLYSGEAPGHETNNRQVAYGISFVDDLGLSDADFADIETDGAFALRVTMSSHLAYRGMFLPEWVSNSPEAIGHSFTVVGIPEPGTLMLLACGATGALLRRTR